MTLESFRTRVVRHAILLDIEGLPTDLETVIMWDCEWQRKWSEAMRGKYDA